MPVRQELEGDASGQVRRSGRLVLNPQKQELRRGKAFPFSFECTDLGELRKVKIGHDNVGYSVRACSSFVARFMVGGLAYQPLAPLFDMRICTLQPNWQCEEIAIRHVSSDREWRVEVHAWFDAKKGDKQIEREFIIDQSDTDQAGRPTPEPEPEPQQEPGKAVGGGAEAPTTAEDMPPGLTKMQQMAWRKKNAV